MIKGIDVSHHQGKINWSKVKNSGIKFAMIHCGYGIKNDKQIDSRFRENILNAKENGIHVGIYHYSYANSSIQASEEANFCLEIIKGYEIDYPVCYDIEDKSISKYSIQAKTDMCKSFCNKIEEAGYYAMIYCNKDWYYNHLYMDELNIYDLWLADYYKEIPSISCGIWQNSDHGKVDGIDGHVDLNIAYKDYYNIIKNKDLNGNKNIKNIYKNRYTVKEGDNLWNIAKKVYGDSSKYNILMEINGLSNDLIHPGLVLYY